MVVLAGIALFVGYLYYQFVSFAVPPKIEVTEPASDAIAQSADFVVKGRTVPEGRVTVQVFPGPLTVADIHPNSDGTFSVNVQLNPGSNHIIVEVLDVTGKVGRASRTVRLDTSAASSPGQPLLIVEEPANGATFTNAQVLVRGRFDPTVTALTVNGVQLPISPARLFEIRFTYPAGQQTINIVARKRRRRYHHRVARGDRCIHRRRRERDAQGWRSVAAGDRGRHRVPGPAACSRKARPRPTPAAKVRLRSGNGAATMVSYNGQPAVALGQQGEVVERVYTAQ